ncbi:cellobiose dehydrogenase [Sphaerosporella brunnea]|uniref:Cellobiose dehydrogenase n=1 Tax=Sphaerosporella brunnea TaxID=1250544 RepID=A0A5J5F9Y6_9PEZI|nr:cellobiose dehydrogenase [Sphaerosporella brunnea]
MATAQFSLRALLLPILLLSPAATARSWDYIIVGSGPAGLVLSDRLSATGKSTLLLEAGVASTYASGGREGPSWLRDSNEPLSRFDVPGFFGAFLAHPDGHQCPDIPFPAGCVLGGGSAVNSALWFLPPGGDLPWVDEEEGEAVAKARKKIPGTTNPSMDGKMWFPESFDILGKMMRSLGWSEVDANKEMDRKDRCFARASFGNTDGERGGPLTSYFLAAEKRPNFEIVYGARVERVLRTAGKVVGLEFVRDRKRETVNLAEDGKAILSAGVFGSAKILWQSGIGTRDQLEIIKAVKGDDMIPETEWIDLPVGYNLQDHPATYVVFKYPGVGTAYNYSGAYENPIPEDAQNYLQHRAGPLASSNARISMWHEIKGSDGVVRTLQWNGRTGTAGNFTGPDLLLLTNYLTHGQTTRGRIGLTPGNLNHKILESPYLITKEDVDTVIQSFQEVLEGVKNVEGLELLLPDLATTTIDEFIRNYSLPRGSSHWIGSAAMGSVVDYETKVLGMENLYVVDASILTGATTSNPMGAIVVMAERAAELLTQETWGCDL